MAIYTDDFNRADYGFGVDSTHVNWPQRTLYLILLSNGVAVGPAPYQTEAYGTTPGNDQYSQVKVITTAASDRIGVLCRSGDLNSTSGYVFCTEPFGAGVSLYRLGAGPSRTQIATDAGVTYSADDVFRIEVSGTTITGKINGATKLTTTDATFASGQVGLYGDYGVATTVYMDDWEGGDLGAGAAVPSIGSAYRIGVWAR